MSKSDLQNALRWCHTCGRSFNWRPSMSMDWANVRYCSKTCRSKKPHNNKTDQGIERSFLSLMITLHMDPILDKRKINCEQVQDHDGGERSTDSSTGTAWRERYRRAARRLANVQLVCEIEHSEKGDSKWSVGDGKGRMRVWIKDGKLDDASTRLDELASLLKTTESVFPTRDNDSVMKLDGLFPSSDTDTPPEPA